MPILSRLPLLLASGFAALATPAAARPVTFAAAPVSGSALVLPLGSEAELAGRLPAADAASGEAILSALRANGFSYDSGSSVTLHGIGRWPQIVVLGTGRAPLTGEQLLSLGGRAAAATANTKGPVSLMVTGLSGADPATRIATGFKLRSYSFNRYKSPVERDAALDQPLTVVTDDAAAAARFASTGQSLADGVSLARDLVNEPANILSPEAFVQRTQQAFRGIPNVAVRVLDEAEMRRVGMGAILSVGQGSPRPPRMLVVHYRGAGGAPLAIAGKGITFDSGGISLKPGEGMWRMKGDMAGAASTIGAVLSLARSRAPVHVVGIAALAENMPGGSATRPGDIVRAMNGRTIEIINTDAEGRVVLADAVAFAERDYRPSAIVTIATLTGAKVTALGDEYAGLFSRDDALARQLEAAATASGELAWRLPLHPNHARDMESPVADIRNSAEGTSPGASLGAHFISYFAERTPWAHLDVAGNTLSASASDLSPAGANGFGVRLLDQFARSYRPSSSPPAQASGQQ